MLIENILRDSRCSAIWEHNDRSVPLIRRMIDISVPGANRVPRRILQRTSHFRLQHSTLFIHALDCNNIVAAFVKCIQLNVISCVISACMHYCSSQQFFSGFHSGRVRVIKLYFFRLEKCPRNGRLAMSGTWPSPWQRRPVAVRHSWINLIRRLTCSPVSPGVPSKWPPPSPIRSRQSKKKKTKIILRIRNNFREEGSGIFAFSQCVRTIGF